MTPLEALQAATINGAELLSLDKDLGAIEPGKFADFVAVPSNPLDDITVMEHVAWVMKSGVVVKPL
jgi:imidazolonepropionase-like amidohydrolase